MEEQIIINKTDKANSFEVGSQTKGRVKIYFGELFELYEKLKELKDKGFEIENMPILS